jgi:subtilase family serine protease
MSVKIRTAVSGAAIAALGIAATLPASAATTQPRATLEAAPSWTAHTAAASPSATQRLRLSVTLKLRDQAGAEALAQSVSTPGSSSYRKFVSAASWRDRFAPTSATVTSVTDWLSANGFTVGAIPANHRAIAFTGTVAQAEKAFGTSLKTFNRGGVTVVAPTSATTVPASIAGAVAAVGGLDTSRMAVPNTKGGPQTKRSGSNVAAASASKAQLPPPDPVFKNGRPCSTYFGQKKATTVPQIAGLNPLTYAPCGYQPAQIRGAYGLDTSQAAGYDGRGVTVAIVDAFASPYIEQDAMEYAQRNDPTHPLRDYQFDQNLPATFNSADACGAGGWYGEETLDVEAVHAMAPAAKILYVGAESCNDPDIDAAVNTIVDNQLANVVSNSYGETEDVGAADELANVHQTLIQAAAEGISFVYSSGDDGDEIAASGIRQTDVSASDPYATAVGGTSLAVNASNGYGFEQGWGTGKTVLSPNGKKWDPLPPAYLYGGGGGESDLFGEPWYQKGVVPNAIAKQTHSGKPGRTVPDVSMVGDPSTGYLVGQRQSFPNGSIKYGEYRIGGTSLSAPLFAGTIAVASQVAGGPLGFLNPALYGSIYGTSAVRDVDHGRAVTDAVVRVDYNNGLNANDGTTISARTLNQTGTIYTRPGYDDVTGVGSPNGVSFLLGMASAG